MAHYKCIASRPEDRQLLLDALPPHSSLHDRIQRTHQHALTRSAQAVDHSAPLTQLAQLAERDSSLAPSIAVAVDALNKEARADATYRRQQGIVTLNFTRADCDVARQALKDYARAHPAPALVERCRLLYRRLA